MRLATHEKHWPSDRRGRIGLPWAARLADASDATLPILLASLASVLRRGARFSARIRAPVLNRERRGSPSSPARLAAPALWRWDRFADASHEVSLSPFSVYRSRRTAQGNHALGHPASTFCNRRHPMPRRLVRPCGFYCLAFPMRWLCLLETPSLRVIRDRLTIGARTGLAIGLFSRPGRGFH